MKKLRSLLVLACAVVTLGFNSYAGEVKSLDEVTATEASVESTQAQSEESTQKSDSGENDAFIKGLANAADLSEYNSSAAEFGAKGNKFGSFVFQVISYVLPVALGIMVVLDFVAIVVAPTRKLLTGGTVASGQGQQNQQGSAFGGSSFGGPSFGGPSFGGPSFGSPGFGSPGFGGGSSFGAPAGRGGQTGSGTQLVSDLAIRAIGEIPQVGILKALGHYGVSMLGMFIAIAVLLVLAGTGIGTQLGLTIGKYAWAFLKGFVSF